MINMIKKFLVILSVFFCGIIFSGYAHPDVYVIDAAHNSAMHNNLGLQALTENNYYEAIQQFQMAIALNPNTQATSIYYNNLGKAYMEVGYYKEAQRCYENAITQYSLNFEYYQNLVKNYQSQRMVKYKLREYQYKSKKKVINMVPLGLLYIANGQKRQGIITLDEFCMKETSLLITNAVRNYLNKIAPKN